MDIADHYICTRTYKFVENKKRVSGTIDVLIPCVNEPYNLIRKTLLYAKDMKRVHKIWLLDDGKNVHLKKLANELNVKYITRNNRDNAKAGNINNALKLCRSEFVAIIDSEEWVNPYFLDRLMTKFSDPRIGYVQGHVTIRNLETIELIGGIDKLGWYEQLPFQTRGQIGRSALGAAAFCGSAAIIRRSLIDEIGGMPTETITEDFHFSIKAHKAGYDSVFVPEPLVSGLGASNLDVFNLQRVRWGSGNLKACILENIFFSSRLSLIKKLCFFSMTFAWLRGCVNLFLYLTPATAVLLKIYPFDLSFSICVFLLFLFFLKCVILSIIYPRNYHFFGEALMEFLRVWPGIIILLKLFGRNSEYKVTSKEPMLSSVKSLIPYFSIAIISIGSCYFSDFSIHDVRPLELAPYYILSILCGLFALTLCLFVFKKNSDVKRVDI